ncbi:hypothetical protein [Bombiscardovia coagulans]|uniref:Uncharacterized protein n=1 Tax=Bombiscardovia coagulans TaxID=686666 RepID=A0A261EQW3_9BIFI|nr:hypothetical protein [Bombiscardovia coagulans]OZG49251.1 hypothetical protein BOCO_1060 [Bombiscardovia coagulans]
MAFILVKHTMYISVSRAAIGIVLASAIVGLVIMANRDLSYESS